METEIRKGDWVSFMSSGKYVIGEVIHTVQEPIFPHNINVITTAGQTCEKSIIQISRSEHQESLR